MCTYIRVKMCIATSRGAFMLDAVLTGFGIEKG